MIYLQISQVPLIMDFGNRNTQKYTFKSPNLLLELQKLGSSASDIKTFNGRYEKILFVLNTHMKDGFLVTLVQCYDPAYRCFTFLDYQLVPTLKEYFHLIGLPFLVQVPFS